MLCPSWCVRVRVKIAECNFLFCNGPAAPPAIYSEPRFHESFVVNSQQSIRGTSLGKNTVVLQHSTGEHVTLYRPNSEIFVQENIFVVSFHNFSALVSN